MQIIEVKYLHFACSTECVTHFHYSFQKAFKQIAATIRLCFVGLSTFVVEFVIVFGSFCCFFYFVLNAKLRNFFNVKHTIQNTIAMSIGKFNFGSLRAASEMAAWIFFAFSSEYRSHNFFLSSSGLLLRAAHRLESGSLNSK